MKRRIDHSNYEAWLLDRLEGRLGPAELRALEDFLWANPGLDDGREGLPTIDADTLRMARSEKAALKRALPPLGLVAADTLDDHLAARLEGDCSPEQERALERFLEAHPEHARDARLMSLVRVEAVSVPYAGKSALQRHLPPIGMPTRLALDDFLVARLEGDLDAEQDRALQQLLDTDEKAQRAWRTVQATRIVPVQAAYPDKQGLKKGATIIAIGGGMPYWRWAAAASIALLLGLGWWWMRGDRREAPELVRHQRQLPSAPKPQQSGSTTEQAQEQPEAPGSMAFPVQQRRSTQVVRHPAEFDVEPQPMPEPEVPEAPMAQQPDAEPDPERVPVLSDAPVAESPVPAAVASPNRAAAAPTTLAQAITGAMRERVLATDPDPARPLDAADAEAAADRALRSVAGPGAQFAMQRDAQGRTRGFDLRVGRHLALSARR